MELKTNRKHWHHGSRDRLGTWNYNGGVEPLRKGIELGASLIDTAEGYYTEDVVGKSY